MKKVFKTMAFTLLGLVLSSNLWAAVTAVSASGIESGKSYVIVATYNENDYLLKPATFATKSSSTAAVFDATKVSASDAWVFTKSGDTWTIKLSTGEGLYFTNDNNGVACAENKGASFSIAATTAGATTSYLTASDGTNTRYLALYQGSNWRCYKNTSNGVPTIQLYSISTTPTPPADPFTVTLKDTETALTETSAGAGVELPTRTTTCEGYSFAGWSETNCGTEETTTAPTLVTITDNRYYPSEDVDLYPVFKRTVAGGGDPQIDVIDNAATATGTSGKGTTAWATDFDVTKNATYTIHTMGLNDGMALRWNTSGFLETKTPAGANIQNVTASGTSGKSIKIFAKNVGDADYTSIATLNLSGENNDISYDFKATENYTHIKIIGGSSATDIKKITITYGAASTTYYITTPQCDPSAPSIAASAVAFGTTYAVTGSEQITVTGANLSNAIVASIKEENTIYSTEGTLTAEGGNLTIKYDATGKEAGQYDATLVLTSGETSVEYAISLTLKTYTTCAQANSLAKDATATLGAFDVVYVNGNYIYIKDNTGSTLLYIKDYGLVAGDRVAAGMEVKGNPYNGLPEAIPTTDYTALTVTHNDFTPSPEVLSAAPTAADVNKYVKLANVKANATKDFTTSSSSDETTVEFYSTDVTVRNGFKQALSFASGTYYDMIGTVARYNSTIQIYPISIEEKEATKYAITFTEPIENGSASVDADDNKAVAGATITITTNPADGYKDGTITVVANDETPIEVTDKQFEMPAQPVTITVTFVEKAKYAITWNDRGNNTQTNVTEGEGLVLPENPTAPTGWEFVGWTAIEGYSHETDAPAFAKNGDAVTMATTYYAVYAMVDGDAATGWKLSTGAPVADEQVILAAKGGEDYYAMYANTVDGAATATKLILNDDGIVTNTDRLYWDVVAASYSTYEGLGLGNDLTKNVSSEEQPVYLHLNSSVTKLTTGFQNGVFEFAQSGEGYTLLGTCNNKYLTFAYTADPETASYSVAGEGGCVLYVFRYASAQYFKYTTAPAPQVTIHFELGDGEGSIDDVMINKGSDYVVTSFEPTPATGYDFIGWLYNEVTYVADQTISNVQTNITLTAQYEAKTYAINYDLDGGSWDGAEGVDTYTYGVGVILPTNVEKEGNNFAGWYAQGAENPTTVIEATETGDKSFTAHWIPATSRTITYIGADEHITFTNKPMSIDGEEPGFEVTYTLDDHYQINSIIVKVGETTLTEDEVTWNATSLKVMPEAESFADNVTITFDIQPIEFTVQWLVNGTPIKEVEHVLEGTTYGTLEAPEDPDDNALEFCDANKFMGWATEALSSAADQEYFDLIKVTDGYIIDADNCTLYAVFATVGQSNPTLTKLTSTDDLTAGDNIVITAVGENFENLMYQETVSSSYVAYKSIGTGEGKMELTPANIAANNKNYWTLTAGSDDKWKLGDETNGYLNGSSSSNNLSVSTSGTIAEFTISYSSNHFKISSGSKNVGSRSDLTGDNQYKFRMGGTITLDFYKFVASSTTYTNYITNCVVTTYRVKFDANAPAGETITGELPAVVDVDPTEDYTIPTDNYLTANHYTQIGWNEEATATTAQTTVVRMAAGESTTLYAIWKAKHFTISVKTAPTKVDYKTNAIFNPEGLVITKTYDGGFSEDVAYAGHESEFSFNPSLETPLSTAITEVTITYAGKTCTQAITVEEAVIPTYYWVANATELQAGDKIILICGDKNAIAGPMGEEKYFASEELTATINKGTVQVEDAYEFTLSKEGGNWTLTSSEGTIGATAAKALSTTSGTTTWSISFDEKGNALITSTTSGYGTIKYNSSSPRFLNYASGQTDIQIYAKRDTRKTLREGLADGKMYSFCPAYNLAYVEGATFFQPDYMDAAYVHFVEATEIKAGYGYILEGNGDDLKAFEVGVALTEAVTADAENTRGMQGVLKDDATYDIDGENEGYKFTETSYSQALVANNHLQYVGAGNVVVVGRAYLDLDIIATLNETTDQERPGARRVAINFGGQAPTNLNGLNGNVKATKILREGQLYIIRDAKTYNAQGIEVQ